MIVYFDTSATIPLLVDEAGSEAAARLWGAADRVVTSRLLYAEARAALAQAHRMGRLDDRALSSTLGGLDGVVDRIDHVEVSRELIHRAGVLAQEQALRGYDAIHLASAELLRDDEFVLAAGDHDLLRAARELDLAVAPIG